jgi:hypothetical protein
MGTKVSGGVNKTGSAQLRKFSVDRAGMATYR